MTTTTGNEDAMALTADTQPTSPPVYEAVLLVRPEAWPLFARWLPRSGLVTSRVPSHDRVPRFDLAPTAEGPPRPRLSAREFDVLELMADGLQNPEIAAKLGVSVDTVKTHSKHLYRKLRVNSRVHAVHIAHQLGILSATPPTT